MRIFQYFYYIILSNDFLAHQIRIAVLREPNGSSIPEVKTQTDVETLGSSIFISVSDSVFLECCCNFARCRKLIRIRLASARSNID